MNVRHLAVVASLPLPIAAGVGGSSVALGYAMGAGGAALNLWAWWLLLGVIGRAVAETRNPRGATSVVILSFLLKAPLLMALVFSANRLGDAAVRWCAGGIVLVYSLLVVWALGRS